MDIKIANGFALDGEVLIDEDTGEIVDDPIHLIVPRGTRLSTPNDRERNRLAMEERLNREKFFYRDGERYFFARKDVRFEDVPPALVTRLIYLSTYAGFEDNVLMLTQRKKMKRKDLAGVLKVSAGSASDFWRAVHPRYVAQNEDGSLALDTTLFRRGRLPRNSFTPYQQFYDAGIRSLYEAASGKHLKQMGYLFKLLPFISTEFNLICRNPDGEDLERIQLMSISEFCFEIGYDVKHISDLLKVYNEVRFDVNGQQERFCTLIYNGLNTADAIICVNPAIMYSGSNPSRVEITRLYFRD